MRYAVPFAVVPVFYADAKARRQGTDGADGKVRPATERTAAGAPTS